MSHFAKAGTRNGVSIALTSVGTHGRAETTAVSRLERVHVRLSDGAPESVLPLLASAYRRAARVGGAAGAGDSADELAAAVYAADVIVGLAAEGELEAADTQVAAAALAETRDEPFEAASLDLFLRAVSSPQLLELPPVAAAEIQLLLLIHLDIAAAASLWRRTGGGQLECLLSLGSDATSRRVRAAAKAAVTGKGGIALLGGSTLRTAQVRRFGDPTGAIVVRLHGDPPHDVAAYLDEAAIALSLVLEREMLLERDAAREHVLVSAGEKRLMRLGFDLHDGPIQDVLALAADTRELRDQVDPFVLESHRELVYGRFDDLLGRLDELDRRLREVSHSLETKSVVSRPLSEILHREIEAFGDRSDIRATLEVRGDPDSLNSAQRITVFRAVQESLANVREHSGATDVEIRVRARRSTVDVRITDNGQGFEVSRALARAAQRGRLGLVGMGERVRMLGGTFEIDSKPGGPTSLRFSLPRWEPFTAVPETR
jgi:signal transduction histidine kinase